MSTTSNKKRRSGDEPPHATKAYVEKLEMELLETKKKLVAAQDLTKKAQERGDKAEERAEKAEAKVESTQKDKETDVSDGDDSADPDPTDSWMAKYLELRAYRISHGDCAVPQKHSIGQWVNNQRRAFGNVKNGKKGLKINQERITMLESLGFNWGKKYPAPTPWEDHFDELQKYQKAMGNCNVPLCPTNPGPLAKWVSCQRSGYRRFRKGRDSLLALEQIERLNEIGFHWKGPRLT